MSSSQSDSLNPEERAVLLRLARETIESTAGGRELPDFQLDELPPALRRVASSFVTISKHGQLRGCIGAIKAQTSLARDVQIHAAAAASRDPRFSPLNLQELDDIEIEISVLSEPQLLSYDTPQDLLAKIQPGQDGVILEVEDHRATFLPQVWTRVQTPEDFISLLCQKAHLPTDYWLHNHLDIKTYRVESFHESVD